jgi:mannose-6-phosphate isomerase-like protein (cupin superfamily)
MVKATAPTRFPRTAPVGKEGPSCRAIIAPVETGWTEPAMFEWELKAESWTDEHPHCEYNYVIEGQLFVDSGGVTVEALAGDVVRVPAGPLAATGHLATRDCLLFTVRIPASPAAAWVTRSSKTRTAGSNRRRSGDDPSCPVRIAAGADAAPLHRLLAKGQCFWRL